MQTKFTCESICPSSEDKIALVSLSGSAGVDSLLLQIAPARLHSSVLYWDMTVGPVHLRHPVVTRAKPEGRGTCSWNLEENKGRQ